MTIPASSTYIDQTVGGLDAPARALRAVTPHDATLFTDGACRALWVGGAGDVAILADTDSSAVTIASVPAGTVLPIRAKRVNATGTTATSIVALY